MFKSSKVNKMHIIILSQKVRWFGGKGFDLTPWNSKINFHK
jgi:coproporphyrinogen III oxidase